MSWDNRLETIGLKRKKLKFQQNKLSINNLRKNGRKFLNNKVNLV